LVNTSQTMSTGVKNKFQAISGQNHHFRSKPSLVGQYESNHVDWDKKNKFQAISGQNRVHQVKIGQTMLIGVKIELSGYIRSKLDPLSWYRSKNIFWCFQLIFQ